MNVLKRRRGLWVWMVSLVAVGFGLLTIKEGGTVLFGGEAARAAVGNYVPFVLWFNFLAGFAYVIAGAGLWALQRWAFWLALAIAIGTLVVFAAFGVYVLEGGAYEMRTMVAMTLRTVVWAIITAVAYHRHQRNDERMAERIERTKTAVLHIQSTLSPADAILIGPRQLRAESERFNRGAHGEMVFFNVCLLMYKPQPMFDMLLQTAIDNPRVTSILFILDEGEKSLWERELAPKIAVCLGRDKVREPRWCKLEKNISFILGDTHVDGATEALLSFWCEPFMAHTTKQDVPRYIYWVQKHSELLAKLTDLERGYRFQR